MSDISMTGSQADGASLPTWSLVDLYLSPEDPLIEEDLSWAKSTAETFRKDYAGKLEALSGDELGAAIEIYEAITERLYKVMAFAHLRFAENSGDSDRGRFLQTIQERTTAISTETLFFCLELNRIDEAVINHQLDDPRAGRYERWVRDSRMFLPHQLSDDLEQLLMEKSTVGANSWIRLFDQTLSGMRFDVGGETLTLADTLNLFDHTEAATRQTAALALGRKLGSHLDLFSLIFNTLMKDKEIEDRWRHYSHPIAQRNLFNRVEDEVVDALVTTVQDNYANLSHRYYRLKAKWFGGDELDYWDRNAPLPGRVVRTFGWDEAQKIVLDAFAAFHPQMADIAGRFFDDRWIDAGPRAGKDSGAFCHPVVPSCHPYILLNFYGRSRDVTTLAHEMGHGIHQVLAADQGLLLADTPLTLAESASVFGEMLVFRALLARISDPDERRQLLAGKVESMINTVVRQVAFHEFERRLHLERRGGEVSAERICDIWMDVQTESLGPAMRFDGGYRSFWTYISHFIHAPFYVYAYAFGDCLVNSLYQVYSEGHHGFQEKYLAMLAAGGTLHHRELLRPFGLDASDPSFWQRGMQVISGFIDELEQIP